MRKLTARLHRYCVREKGHLIVAGGYLATTFWHSSAVMSAAYGTAALLATHAINRTGTADEPELKHQPKHLAES
jgi:hypothetical protein